VPQLSPFRGLRYDLSAVSDLSAVLCPPYDVISASESAQLVARHERNAVRLELPQSLVRGEDQYAGAARLLADWQADGTLVRDDEPLVYVYEQSYELPSAGRGVARSFFCRLRLEEYGPAAGVRPHEHTMSGPKEDRFRLLSEVRANLSPVLLLYDDATGGARSAALLDSLTGVPPAATAVGPGGVGQRLWTIDPARNQVAAELLAVAAGGPLTIADGHHRYETALRYRTTQGAGGEADWVLALLYETNSGGLALLPWHRLVSGVSDPEAVLAAAGEAFALRRAATSAELLDALDARKDPGVAAIWTRVGGALVSLAPRRTPGDRLDVSVVSDNLSRMIGSSERELSAAERLEYLSDGREAVAAVDAGRADVAILLRATPVESVVDIAAEGGFMPPKSTYFHPKAATGMVFNPMTS